METKKINMIVLVITIIISLCEYVLADELYVPSPEYPTIQSAINDSNNGDVIIVADGTYTGAGNKNLDFGGRAITVRSQNGPLVTIIDCQNSGRGFYFHSGEDANSIVWGLTIKRGYIPSGGGICCIAASPTIENCIIENNVSYHDMSTIHSYGGGIYCSSNSHPVIIHSTIRNNKVQGCDGIDVCIDPIMCDEPGGDAYGGGIYCSPDGYVIIEDCNIVNNAALGGSGYYGGVIGWPPSVYSGDGYGGGIYGDVVISNSMLRDNYAQGGGSSNALFTSIGGSALGGGVFCGVGNNSIIENCRITDNILLGGQGSIGGEACGGGIYSLGANLTVKTSVIWSNYATGGVGVRDFGFGGTGGDGLGAGIYISSAGILEAENITVSNNIATAGAGSLGGVDGDSIGGGCYIGNADSNIINSIVWNNTANANESIWGSPMVLYSDIEGGWAGEGNIDVDPLFANVDANDFHLQSEVGRWDPNTQSWVKDSNTSPCIDAGDPNSDWKAELWPHGRRINVGAYGGTPQASMSLSSAGNIADLDNDGDVDYNDLKLFTDQWPIEQVLLAEDLDRNGKVDFKDYSIFAIEWFNEFIGEPVITYNITACSENPGALENIGGRYAITINGHYVHFEDVMKANCCATRLWLEMNVNGSEIVIYEREFGGSCLCICDNPVEADLGPFESGMYLLAVYEDYSGFIGITIFGIE